MNQNPYEENLQNVLEKYGRDITKNVKDNKVDPVIGRDKNSFKKNKKQSSTNRRTRCW